MADPYEISAIVDAFRALEILAERGTLGPTELSAWLRCPKNRAFRILRSLVAIGQVEELGSGSASFYRLRARPAPTVSTRAARAAIGVELVEASRRLTRALALMRDDVEGLRAWPSEEPARVELEDVETRGEGAP